ncbi:MAG: NAD-dependent epimerase/dehydratase family protein [Algiphilus sp.]|uniref:NAD-dependent epimerase/dehydratase family protein n=1 Tax=Algiphilus sp. TaxID=1872431 RepID=UPI0032EAF755
MPANKEKTCAVVFGGAGFVGTHLLRNLVERKLRHIVSFDIAEPAEPVSGVEYVYGDVRDSIPVEMVSSVPEIYDVAAVHRTPGHPDHEYYETNVLGALNVREFASRVGANEIVFTSSIAVYGPGEDLKSEQSETNPVSAYGWSKLLAESSYRQWVRSVEDRKLIIVRPAVIFGEGEKGNFTRLAAALRRRMFFYPGRDDTIKACGYVEELICAIDFVRSLERKYTVFNFCFPECNSIASICHTFKTVAGLPRPLGKVPLSLLKVVAFMFEALNEIGIRNSISRARIEKLTRSTNVQPATLIELGYEFETDLASGLRRWAQVSEGRFV